MICVCFFVQAEDGIRDLVRSRGLGDVYKRQLQEFPLKKEKYKFSIILEQKNNVLLMFAENVGSIFPNTASISFFDGVQRQYAKVNSDSVSYTHLRAHETVLDLVCRLLLENKKHLTTHTIILSTELTNHPSQNTN